MNCSHPNILRGADGVLRCMSCGADVEAPEPPTVNASGRKIGFEAETEKPKRTRTTRKKAEA